MRTNRKPKTVRARAGVIPRRHFLGMAGLALSLPGVAEQVARAGADAPKAGSPPGPPSAYWDRTDRFEEKLKLLEAAWQRKDFRLARALAHSLRDTASQAQAEEDKPGQPLVWPTPDERVESMPGPWRKWAQGWSYCRALTLEGGPGREAQAPGDPGPDGLEPVEVLLSVPAERVVSLRRELRLTRMSGGILSEVRCQVHGEVRRGGERWCKLLFMAGGAMPQTFLLFYGNPDAELPGYESDLSTTGEGFGLDIDNQFYRASLSRQMGQLERMTLKREHGLELFSGGEGHGEPPGIDWAHDYVDSGNFQKLRITLWDRCPDYEVVRGPLCTIVRRWGFPYSPVHPVFSPTRLLVDVEYRFYAGLPWFHKSSVMRAVKDFEAEALRDDEWVFSGQSFTDMLWVGADGKVRLGEVDPKQRENLWGVGFFHKDTGDSFVALFLEHRAEGLPELRHSGSPILYYRWHGHVWSRYPLPTKQVPAGAVLHQKNAYVALPFKAADGPRRIEELRRRLAHPLVASPAPVRGETARECPGRLGRPGETGDSPIPKRVLWDALRDCKDAQLYTADVNIVDLGLVHDVRVRSGVVHVVMAMPHRGRPRVGYFEQGSVSEHPTVSMPVRERLLKVAGVQQVVVEQTWEPGWSSNELTEEGRRKLGV